MSIKVEGVTKIYGKQKALDNISFEIKTGEVVGFLGPNGAGKSTMMKILTCFVPQTMGKASVCGFDVTEQSIEVRKNVGYLPENNPLYLDMYVKEYLEFIAGLHKVRNVNGRIKEMIESTGLQLEQNKKIGALSKGYRQRVGLAQAMIHDPQVLILDEPTSGLDPNQLEEIRNLIVKIGKEKTVMLSTHIMQEVEAVCGRVIIINKGIIVANDTTQNVQRSTSDQQIITVEFDKAVSEKQLQQLSGIENVKQEGQNSWILICKRDLRADIFQFAVANQLSVLSMRKEERRLEDVFKTLTATGDPEGNTKHDPSEKNYNASKDMAGGFVWLALGILATLAGYSVASKIGGTYYIMYGAIAVGIGKILRAIIRSNKR